MSERADHIRSDSSRQPASDDLGRDRPLRRSYTRAVAVGLAASALLHWAGLEMFPEMRAERLSAERSEELETVQLPPEVEVPPPPERVKRPSTPDVAAGRARLREKLSIDPVSVDEDREETDVPPPPEAEAGSPRGSGPEWVPREVGPKLENRAEIQKLLEEVYPPSLYREGLGGRVIVWVYVTPGGEVARTRVRKSSGYAALDEAARKVARQMEFEPAKNRDRPVAVWTTQAITFATRGR